MTVDDLEFNQIEVNQKLQHRIRCHMCGAQGVTLYADNTLLDGTGAGVTIVLCSQVCEQNFKAHPRARDFINDLICNLIDFQEAE